MRMKIFTALSLVVFGVTTALAQRPTLQPADPNAPPTKYDYHETFGPNFYTKNGNEYRAATGEPGPKYWQNRADYQLDVKLNEETNEIGGSVVVTYTNNSPQKLGFLWMQLDQNLFKLDSRGNAIVTLQYGVPVSRN